MANYEASGFRIVAERHLNDPGNFSFAQYEEADVEALVHDVARARPDAIAIFCTNLRGARLACSLEAALGIPILDTIAVAVWRSLLLAGADPGRVEGWGRLFAIQQPGPLAGTSDTAHV